MGKRKKILVTGGCGYIGSHTIIDLLDKGYEVVSIDNLSNSKEDALDRVARITGVRVTNHQVDLRNLPALRQVFEEHPDFYGIIHFAALKSVGESVHKPLLYYENNLGGLVNLLHCTRAYGVPNFVFSSSCSVYGNARHLPVTEDTPLQKAESPYARTKQMGEEICQDFVRAHPEHNCVLLRYFNPAGAHESGLTGEAPGKEPENLVPVITDAALGIRKEVVVFGNDYPTRDGSCIRDYIHIMDLAEAHSLALRLRSEQRSRLRSEQRSRLRSERRSRLRSEQRSRLRSERRSPLHSEQRSRLQSEQLRSEQDRQEAKGVCEVFNLGSGTGTTVLEAIAAFERSTGTKLPWRIGPRRAGDVVAVYANYDKAARLLGWQPRRSIDDIMRTAWAWAKNRANQKTRATE